MLKNEVARSLSNNWLQLLRVLATICICTAYFRPSQVPQLLLLRFVQLTLQYEFFALLLIDSFYRRFIRFTGPLSFLLHHFTNTRIHTYHSCNNQPCQFETAAGSSSFGFSNGCSARGTYPLTDSPFFCATFLSCCSITWTLSSTCSSVFFDDPHPMFAGRFE
jgi:hypothetical protein